jgi:hypothetical protein
MFSTCFMCIGCCVVMVFCSGYDYWPTDQLSKSNVTIIYCRHTKKSSESWTEEQNVSVPWTPALILGPFVARPFVLTSFTNLHHLLICALTFSVWRPFGWLHFNKRDPHFWWEYHSPFTPFRMTPTFSGKQLGRKIRAGCIPKWHMYYVCLTESFRCLRSAYAPSFPPVPLTCNSLLLVANT